MSKSVDSNYEREYQSEIYGRNAGFQEITPVGNQDIIIVQAESCGRITINDKTVEMPKSNGEADGLHVVVVDPGNGEVEMAQVFEMG